MDNQSSADSTKIPFCKCKDESGIPCFTVHRVSKTDKNKDREFYSCATSRDKGGCGFFCWVEDLYIDEKTGLARKKYIPPPEGYVKKPTVAETLIAYDLRIVQLEESFAAMKKRIEMLDDRIDVFKNFEHEQQPQRPAKVQKTESARQPTPRKQ